MPVYTDVVASRLEKYRAQLEKTNGQNDADIDFAILKYVICQLVDASFSGGGGGGSTSATTIASGINLSTDINEIVNSLSSLDTKALSQSDIVTAIQAAADIDTLITTLASINIKIPSLGQALATGSVPVVLTAAQIATLTPIANPGGFRSAATITRAANTTPYTANDVYGGAFELANIGAIGGHIILSGIRIIFNIATIPAGMGGFTLFLYSSSPPSAVSDNGAFSVPSGDRGTASAPILLTPTGIDLGTAQLPLGGGTVVLSAENLNIQFRLAAGSTSLWGYLVSRGAFTPASASETATIAALSLGV